MDLSGVEVRVLGALVEKQLTTPQAYPLTESALITACNQTTNRDPVVAFEQGTVRRALLDLRREGLVKLVHRPGDRVEKHRHLLDEALGLSQAEIAVLSVLLLRGAQTAAEVRTRTERLHRFTSASEVDEVLTALEERPEPLVARMERQPGQKEARFRHLLSEGEYGAEGERAGVEQYVVPGAVRARSASASEALTEGLDALRAEVAELRARVERLEGWLNS